MVPCFFSCLPFMLWFYFQKHQPYLFCIFQAFKYMKWTLIHAFLLLKTSCVHGLLDCNLQKHHSYLAFSFLTTVDFIYCLFSGFQLINAYCTLFVYLQSAKRHCYFSVIPLTSRNISGTFFVVCLSLNICFYRFLVF